jgi:redox-sensing transcriptional repressor
MDISSKYSRIEPPVPEPPRAIPEPALKRLPLYHRYLQQLQRAGQASVSCTDIGRELSLDPTQVRKDLEAAGIQGRPRVGYATADVVEGIEQFLGWKKVNEAFLVGAGSMGSALLGYRKFEACGLKIAAAFDNDPAKIGKDLRGKRVLPLDKLVGLARRMHILIGIITVPASEAQGVADLLVAGGIRAIWNFAPVRLRLPPHIILHNEDLYCTLAWLSQKLARELRENPDPKPSADEGGRSAPAR